MQCKCIFLVDKDINITKQLYCYFKRFKGFHDLIVDILTINPDVLLSLTIYLHVKSIIISKPFFYYIIKTHISNNGTT